MLPKTFKPMLATMASPFDSEDYIFEIKWDGYRCLAFCDSTIRLQSRNLHDITTVFPDLSELKKQIQKPGCLIDGEIIALRNGKPSFSELQKRAQLRNERLIQSAIKNIPVVFVAFDLLYHNYRAVYQETLETRKSLLEENIIPGDNLIISSFVENNGLSYFNSVAELGLEGVIAKKKGSPYIPGKRVKHWLKFKRKLTGTFVICGFTLNFTTRGEISSLVLGTNYLGNFRFIGMVGTGFSHAELKVLFQELQKIKTDTLPFGSFPLSQPVIWVKPIIVCEVEYLELTDDEALRHPSFKKIRPDLRPEDCRLGES